MEAREIKFRVYCEKHNRWEYYTLGDLICGAATSSFDEGGKFKAETWTEFIYRKDKNGVELYEGDIYKWEYEYDSDYDGDIPIIKTSKGVNYVKSIFDTTKIDIAASESKGVEIIGNIFENPELLK